MDATRHLVVMGVSGVGKSTIAQRLAADLDLELAEGDDFHPRSNIVKMSSGEAKRDGLDLDSAPMTGDGRDQSRLPGDRYRRARG